MRKFNTTNFSLCEPFLDAGYQMFWCDHRVENEQAIAVDRTSYSPSMETNSLAVLIPPNLLDKRIVASERLTNYDKQPKFSKQSGISLRCS